MAVQVATLDILTERAHFEPEVARAIGDAISMQMNHAKDALATKAELMEVRDELKRELAVFRHEVSTEFGSIRAEFSLVRAEIKVAAADARTDMLKFMWTALVSQSALIIGVMYFMLTHLR